MSDSASPWTAARQVSLCSTITWSSNSCPLSRWCYLTISSSGAPFSFSFNLSQHRGRFQWVVRITINNSFPVSCYNNNKELCRLWLPFSIIQSVEQPFPMGVTSTTGLWAQDVVGPQGQKVASPLHPPRGAMETPCFLVRLASTALEFSMNSILFIRPVYLKAFPTLGQPYLLHF